MTVTIGLTGGIATGKSTASNIFLENGIMVIDADIEARIAVMPGSPAYLDIVEYFGKAILLENGQINREELGRIIFSNKNERDMLNRITHPRIRQQMVDKKEKAIADNNRLIILDIPLLFESSLQAIVDKVLVITTTEEIQLARLMERNSYSKEEALARIKAQMSMKEKEKLADVVVYNNGSTAELQSNIEALIMQWTK